MPKITISMHLWCLNFENGRHDESICHHSEQEMSTHRGTYIHTKLVAEQLELDSHFYNLSERQVLFVQRIRTIRLAN